MPIAQMHKSTIESYYLSMTVRYKLDKAFIEAKVRAAIEEANLSRHLQLGHDWLNSIYYQSISCLSGEIAISSRQENQKSSQIIQLADFFELEENINTVLIESLQNCPLNKLIKEFAISKAFFKNWKGIIRHVSQHCRFITSIDINNNEAEDDAIEFIRKADWKFVVYFDGSHNRITSKGVRHLCECQWPHLKLLNLKANRISNRGLTLLAKVKWPNLNQLILDENKITVDGIKSLSHCCWSQLTYLSIGDLGNECLKIVLTSLATRRLKYIFLEDSNQPNNCIYCVNLLAKQDMSQVSKGIFANYGKYSEKALQNISYFCKVYQTF